MHKLTRKIRFSVNPFLKGKIDGRNSFCSNPPGDGFAIFFDLAVQIEGVAEKSTGFVVNVIEIDKVVREVAVPFIEQRVTELYQQKEHIGFDVLRELLVQSKDVLADRFGDSKVTKLTLALNPFRKIAIVNGDSDMVYFSEKFDFAATHKLWNDEFSEEKNFEIFGKCANPTGHGHNYVLEVVVKALPDALNIGSYEQVIDELLVKGIDHKNLNADVPYFADNIPTVENLAVYAWDKLDGKFENCDLHCVTIWETDKTKCCYFGK